MVKNSKHAGLVVAVAWLIIGCCAQATVAQSDPPWSWGPVLGAVSETSAALTWKTTRSVGFDFSYALAVVHDSSGAWDETLTYEGYEGVAEIWLSNLLPDTVYRYQLIFYEGDAVYPTEVGTFRTVDPDERSLAFAVYGATASSPDRHRLVAETILSQTDVAIVFHAGGLVEVPTEERFSNFFWAMGELGRSTSYLPVIGRNDGDEEMYYEAFALPPGGGSHDEQWWSFDEGPIHFVGLDSTLAGEAEHATMQEQTAWLKQDLAGANADFILVFCADTLYSASFPSGINDRLADLWVPIFQQYGVDVVFSSSVHCYEHIYSRGVHYVTTGGGGAALVAAPDSTARGTVFRRYGLLNYLLVTLADDVLRVEAIPVASVRDDTVTLSASGRSIDTFILQANDE